MSALFLPALCAAVLTAGLFARIDVYGAFVRGAKAGMETLLQMAPCLCAVLTLTALLRETGLLGALTEALRPALEALRLPGEAAGGGQRCDGAHGRGQPGGAALLRNQRGERNGVFHRVALSGRGGGEAVALCRSGGACGLCGGGVGGGMAGLRKKR